MTITVQGRTPSRTTDRPTLRYACDCGATGGQGAITAHLHDAHAVGWTAIHRMLGRARYWAGRQMPEGRG